MIDLCISILIGYRLVGARRPSKVMAKAFKAAFQRLIQRLRSLPVGSRLMIPT